MFEKLILAIIVFFQFRVIVGQRQWVLPTTTAAEMKNPYTWYWPYAIAASEAYRDFFVNAQKATNQLYQQAYATQAFSWTQGAANGAIGQAGETANGAMNGAGGMVPGQGGWNGPMNQGGQGGQGGWNGPPNQGGQGGQGNWNGPNQGGQMGFDGPINQGNF